MSASDHYRFTADWFSAHTAAWARHLAHLAGRPGLHFLEVGCFEGRASVWLLENVLTDESSRLDCVDSFGGSFEHGEMGVDVAGSEARFDHNVRLAGPGKVAKFKGPSQEILRRLPPTFYHLAYIDGSHLACDVLEDAILALRLLRPGGLMIFDDYGWDRLRGDPRHPKVGIDCFLGVYRDAVEPLSVGYQVVARKR